MSYQQRTSLTPFAQVYQSSGNWTYSAHPDTKTQSWLTASGTNGYSFSGSGYLFGFWVSSGGSLTRQYLDNTFYTSACYAGGSNQNWANSDDEAINYGNTTEFYLGSSLVFSNYTDISRLNVIRMEA